MKSIVFMVICCLFSAPVGMEGACCGFVASLIIRPTTKLITGPRFLNPTVRLPTSCPNQFTYNSAFRKCYYVSDSKMDFIAANDTCVSFGGSLVIAKTDDEQVFVAQMIPEPGDEEAYIGVTYRTINGTDDFYWLDGTPFTGCRFGIIEPYSDNPVFIILKVDHCSTNWDVSHLAYVVCEATPFY